jgi:GTP cyclohydrolase III
MIVETNLQDSKIGKQSIYHFDVWIHVVDGFTQSVVEVHFDWAAITVIQKLELFPVYETFGTIQSILQHLFQYFQQSNAVIYFLKYARLV